MVYVATKTIHQLLLAWEDMTGPKSCNFTPTLVKIGYIYMTLIDDIIYGRPRYWILGGREGHRRHRILISTTINMISTNW